MVLRPANLLPGKDVATRQPRVLFGDNTVEVQILAQKALHAVGVELIICNDGKGVMEVVSDGGFDLIILDSTLPDMSGVELCRRLTLHPKLADTPILLLKADSRMENKIEILDAGAFDLVRLPLDPQELVIRAKAALRYKALRDELKSKSSELIHDHETGVQLERIIQRVHDCWAELQKQQMLGFVAGHLATQVAPVLTSVTKQIRTISDETAAPELQQQLRGLAVSLRDAAVQVHRLSSLAHRNGETREVGLAALLQDLVKLTRFETEALGLELELETGCRWRGPTHQFAHAFLLLLHNAVEAVARGADEPRIFITLKSDLEWYRIEIADNGPGLDVAIRSHPFEAFQTTKAAPHMGMGLYCAQQLISQLGGQLEIADATLGFRTKVTVILPQNPAP